MRGEDVHLHPNLSEGILERKSCSILIYTIHISFKESTTLFRLHLRLPQVIPDSSYVNHLAEVRGLRRKRRIESVKDVSGEKEVKEVFRSMGRKKKAIQGAGEVEVQREVNL